TDGEGTWYPDDVYLQYDPESGLLRYTIWNEYAEAHMHHYFMRNEALATTELPRQLVDMASFDIGAFAGTWQNGDGETHVIPSAILPGEQWDIYRFPNGSYEIVMLYDADPGYRVKWLFPPGAEMVRYETDGATVPSDTSRARLFWGAFSLTTCCSDKEIGRETFYRVETTPATGEQDVNGDESFTIEQLQRAMDPQWNFGGEPDILNHQIISVQRVERESDYIWFEPAGQYVDASNAVRYRMEVRHRELHIEWHDLGSGFVESEMIIGDYVTSILYNHFVVVGGAPQLLFVVC
ncbi:MAG: hypothetical protein FWC72_06940, partial [Oscillospiraceae bacterium]|nr:hypothetical protein [Oscillospiraceae bacterium]